MKRERVEKWPTEVAMFGAFMGAARAAGWVCYPESCGHDLVMVAGPTLDTARWLGVDRGDVVVVEGKLRAGIEVLAQAVPWSRRRDGSATGADFYVVLTPGHSRDFREVAYAMGVIAIGFPQGATLAAGRWWPEELRQHPPQRLAPVLAVDQEAGAPSPRSVTPWKVAAVRLCLLALSRPEPVLRSADFKLGAASAQSFARNDWIRPLRREGRETVYELRDAADRPDRAYPEIAAALAAESAA